jgi:peptide/nickel transport system substrate-binding protein
MVYLADAQGVSQTIDGVDLTPWDTNTWNIKDWRRIP